MPDWLRSNLRTIPGAPHNPESIEVCALLLLAAHRDDDKWFKAKPRLAEAIALDLIVAAWETIHPHKRRLPIQIEILMVQVLGLPRFHEPQNWSLSSLDRRGKRILRVRDKQGKLVPAIPEDPNYGAQAAARDIAREYEREHNKPISDRMLAKRLQAMGFRTSPASLREWRPGGRQRSKRTNKKA
jgi:hypothetical protein